MDASSGAARPRDRVDRLVREMERRGLDGFLAAQPGNLRYFTGTAIRVGVLLVARGERPTLLVREQNLVAAREAGEWCEVLGLPGGGLWEEAVVGVLGGHLPARTGFDDLSLAMVSALGGNLQPHPGVTAVLRRKKDAGEEALLRQACAIADRTAAAAFEALEPGVSELEVVAAVERSLRLEGAEGTRFPTRFATGRRAADCDAEPSGKAIEIGDMGFFDIGPVHEGYLGDISRGFVVGRPSSEQRRVATLAIQVLERTAEMLRPGVQVSDLCAIAELTFERAGLSGAFRHHLGHGLGLVMDPPLIRAGSTDRLEEGDFVALEPGLYLPELGGVRFENNFRVGRDGPELLTRFPVAFGIEPHSR